MLNNPNIKRIAEQIHKHRKIESDSFSKVLAVGVSNVTIDEKDITIWMLNGEIPMQSRVNRDITGAVIDTSVGHQTYVNSDGKVINKNSKIGGIIIGLKSGLQNYKSPEGFKNIEIHNSGFYVPSKNDANALDIQLNIGEPKPRYFQSLRIILNLLKSTQKEIDSIDEEIIVAKQNNDDEEIERFLRKREATLKVQKEAEQKKQSFIRKYAELRLQPILDPWQDEIKRSHIYDGVVLAIDGGPGTGKTTSLIQRLKFLIDPEVLNEYKPDMGKNIKEKILNQNRNWVFFSPTELLKLFLKNNMISEGLQATDDRVMVWDSFKSKVLKEYKLFNADTQNPFLALRGEFLETHMLPYQGLVLKNILKDFDSFFLAIQNDKLDSLLSIDVSEFSWKNTGLSIQNYINRQEKDYSKLGLIRLYFNLNETFSNEIRVIEDEHRQRLDRIATKVKIGISQALTDEILSIIEKWKTEFNNQSDEDLDEDEDEIILQDPEIDIHNKIKSLLRKTGLLRFDKMSKYTKRDKELLSLLEKEVKLNDIVELNLVGECAYFIKFFARPVKGVVTNLIRVIPNVYKKFRRVELREQRNKWDFEILEHVVTRDTQKNKRIHKDEQSFLLLFINNLIKDCFKVSKLKSKSLKHPYFESYLNNAWPVIGVDEATDFHIIDLLAIKSFGDHEVSAVTYSGDIMQRLTKEGIRSWDELHLFDKKSSTKELIISYRQSPTLLKVAERIYNEATKLDAEYASFMERDIKEPKPLMFINENESSRIEWISSRILEIYKAYNNMIPSIAIFLDSEDQLVSFANTLGEEDCLADVDIKVKACNNGQVLGDENTIRVFSVDYIKGLEFEAVFFHDINKLYQSSDRDLTLKNLYVGLSRASFYMAVTAPYQIDQLHFLSEDFQIDGDWQS